jgi:hypothetical protein
MLKSLSVLLLVTLLGCPTPVCDPTETRCSGQTAEICGSDGLWQTLLDCPADGMVCCWVEADPAEGTPAGHTCLPECPATDGGGDVAADAEPEVEPEAVDVEPDAAPEAGPEVATEGGE